MPKWKYGKRDLPNSRDNGISGAYDDAWSRCGVATTGLSPAGQHPDRSPNIFMRIAFFGGSFDPPHRGHLAIARAAAEAFGLDRVLLAPTGRQPHKPGGSNASFADRLGMVTAMCADNPKLEPSELDAPRSDGALNYTIDTLHELSTNLGASDRLFAIVGADAFVDLPRWRDPKGLLDAAEWIVVSRPGFSGVDLSAVLRTLEASPAQAERVHLLNGVDDPASATDVRALLRAGDDCSGLLTPGVLEYIREHHLYGT